MFDNELLKRIRAKFPRAEGDAFRRRRAFMSNKTRTLVIRSSAEAEAGTKVECSANV